jgi:SAM-dependent methyltransferase
MPKSPIRRLKTKIATSLDLPHIRERQEAQRERLDNLSRRLNDAIKNLEHRAVDDERRSREFAISYIDGHIVATQDKIDHLHRLLADKLELQNGHFENRLSSLNSALLAHFDEMQRADRQKFSADLSDFRRVIDGLRQDSSGSSVTSQARELMATSAEKRIDDSLYVRLEDVFRGSRELIHSRQSNYLDLVRELPSGTKVIDLGCGRGEWLQLLKEAGIDAVGVDGNQAAVRDCVALGLNVQLADILQSLRELPDSSVGALTLFQVLEHMPFNAVLEILRECRRTLVPNGVLIAEIPNAKNVSVASGTFWIDPTHERPWYPNLLEFMAETVGFARVEGRYVNPLRDRPNFEQFEKSTAETLSSIFDAIYGPADFALVAHA